MRTMYPAYKTLMISRKWRENLQQYNYAIQSVINEDGLSIARGRRSWIAGKEVADAFNPGRRLTNPESSPMYRSIEKEDFSGRRADSTVSLKFRLHPLNSSGWKMIDESGENSIPMGWRCQRLQPKCWFAMRSIEAIPSLRLVKYYARFRHANLSITTSGRISSFVQWDAIDDLRDTVATQIAAFSLRG